MLNIRFGRFSILRKNSFLHLPFINSADLQITALIFASGYSENTNAAAANFCKYTEYEYIPLIKSIMPHKTDIASKIYDIPLCMLLNKTYITEIVGRIKKQKLKNFFMPIIKYRTAALIISENEKLFLFSKKKKQSHFSFAPIYIKNKVKFSITAKAHNAE